MNFNKVIIAGRVTKTPIGKNIPNGTTVTSFGVATNNYFKSKSGETKEKTDFHNMVMFGNVADIATKYLEKGSLALFEGRLQTRKWIDKKGNNRYTTEVIVEKIQLGPKPQNKKQTKIDVEKTETEKV